MRLHLSFNLLPLIALFISTAPPPTHALTTRLSSLNTKQYTIYQWTIFSRPHANYTFLLEFPRKDGRTVIVGPFPEVMEESTEEPALDLVTAKSRVFRWSGCYPFPKSEMESGINLLTYHDTPILFPGKHIKMADIVPLELGDGDHADGVSIKHDLEYHYRQILTSAEPWTGYADFDPSGTMKYLDNEDGCMETSTKVVTVLPGERFRLSGNTSYTFFVSTGAGTLRRTVQPELSALQSSHGSSAFEGSNSLVLLSLCSVVAIAFAP